MMIKTALGLDLAIKTGSLVQIKVETDHNAIAGYRVLHSWTRGPSIKDDLSDIARYFELVVLSELNVERVGYYQTMAIDWNQKEVYWSANKANSNVKTFIAGYIACHCSDNGIAAKFVSPAKVREFFGFNQKVPKSQVQRHFLNTVPVMTDHTGLPILLGQNDHDLDAIILAYIAESRGRVQTL